MSFAFRPVDAPTDAALLHDWFGQDRARYWGMLTASVDDVRDMYAGISSSANHDAFLGSGSGSAGGAPEFLMERYDPALDPVGAHFTIKDGDVGMHLLVAPTGEPVHGFTRSVMTAVLGFLFADPTVQRIVVEPDVRNEKIQALNAVVGFEPAAVIHLPDKDAQLSFCTREGYLAATAHPTPGHLTPDRWATASRHLLRKAISEFAHEWMLVPTPAGPGEYVLVADDGVTEYRFAATQRALGHWSVPAEGIRRHRDGVALELDVLEFILDFRLALGVSDEVLPMYLEEISSTLAGSAYKLEHSVLTSGELADPAPTGTALDATAYGQRIERSMTEGHPCFVANNGRLGFGLSDYLGYAPETGARVRLVWLAVSRANAHFTASGSMDYDGHLRDELGEETVAWFAARLASLGLDSAHYLFMPVHPWQWENKLTVTFAADIARRDVVYLGTGADHYQAQQSIRTFFNLDVPERCYVKTALSVLNMGFMRGLSPQYMKPTPAINDWLDDLVKADPQLQRVGFSILREVAAIGYHNRYYEAASPAGSPYQKMLSALWRESPLPQLEEGQRVATMAALLHLDQDGRPFVSALIEQSGLAAADWLRRYLRAYLVPLVHCLNAYELAFMPHGENVILVLEDGVPVRIMMKDIAEEIAVMGEKISLPEEISRIRVHVPPEERVLTVFTDVFDCFFRFLAATLAEDGQLGEDEFWAAVAETVADYQEGAPELAESFRRHDLFAPEFPLSCLNRLQLRNNRQMLDITDPSGSLQLAGTLANPIARFRR